MSVIERTEADKLLRRVAGALPMAYTRSIYFDGDAATKLMFKSLPGDEAIIDISGLYRQGINFGPTFHNVGPSSVTIEVALGSRDLAQKAREPGNGPELALYATSWATLATLAKGAFHAIGGSEVFTLAKITFTAGSPGELLIAST